MIDLYSSVFVPCTRLIFCHDASKVADECSFQEGRGNGIAGCKRDHHVGKPFRWTIMYVGKRRTSPSELRVMGDAKFEGHRVPFLMKFVESAHGMLKDAAS